MDSADTEESVRSWLEEEFLKPKESPNSKPRFHYQFKFPPGPNGHVFSGSKPKNRDLVAIASGTRVDGGQQANMRKMIGDPRAWGTWVHRIRMLLTQSGVDWMVHMGHKDGRKGTGPFQAFNVSEPIWLDGLSKNELMHALRRLWLAKLSVIHEVKFHFGPGDRTPGPVDDWGPRGAVEPDSSLSKDINIIEGDDSGGFGSGFDPSEWA